MVRCGCASDQCSCVVVAGENVAISGSGTRSNPYSISAATQVILEGTGIDLVDRITGEVIMFVGGSAPTNWLFCDGAAVSRSVYADLFAVIGTSFGGGDGSTTFNLPNFAGMFPMGASGTAPKGTVGGDDTLALTAANLPAHTHSINHAHGNTGSAGTHDHQLSRSASTGGNAGNIPLGQAATDSVSGGSIADDRAHTHTTAAFAGNSGSTGSGDPVDIRPPFVAINFLIRA